jgi:superfamily II DNA or RNA helicase
MVYGTKSLSPLIVHDREVLRLLTALDPQLAQEVSSAPAAFDELDIDDEDRASAVGQARVVPLIRSHERPSLFDYQIDLAARMANILHTRGTALLSLPTGAGKTRTAIAAVFEARMAEQGVRICWMAPTYELLDQAFSAALQLWRQFGPAPDMRVALAGEPAGETDLWLTTPQAVASRARRREALGNWRAVIFDEAHQMAARTFRGAVDAVRHQAGAQAVVGLSATPGRATEEETELLVDLFEGHLMTSPVLGAHPVEELQRRGVLAQLRFRALSSRTAASLDEVERLRVVIRACRFLARRKHRVLVFTSSVAAAKALSIVLVDKGVSATWVSGAMPMQERQSRIDAFATGTWDVLANQRLLATGYDCPAVTDVIIQTKITSPVLFEQVVGRVARGRLTGGSVIGTVWQFEDHLALHGLPQSYYRYRDYDWS